jgi:hypothetical protein
LFEGLKRLSELELRGLLDIQVREERSVMKWIIPRPTGDAPVIIETNPTESLEIGNTNAAF